MAIYNEILAPRYARALQKLFGIKGSVPTRQLAGEISTALPLFYGRENRYLEDFRTFGSRITAGPVAAQDSVVRLHNPVTSGIVGVLESIIFFSTVADPHFLIEFNAITSAPNVSLGTTLTPALFDSRFVPPQTGNNAAALVLSQATNVGQGNHVVFKDLSLAAGVQFQELINYDNQEIPILPGCDIQWRSSVLNTGLTVSVLWRERNLEESERA